jgi:hypothetical protein
MRDRSAPHRTGLAVAAVLLAVLALSACEDLLQEPESGARLAPLSLEDVSGNDQTGPVGRALPALLRVRMFDSEGRPVSRMRVEWSAGSGSGSATPRNGFTDDDGFASATWTLGPVAGPQEMRAAIGGLGVVFRATGTR